jgi:hypothetical protein
MKPFVRWWFLLAGACDAATGLGLVLAPLTVLGLMGVTSGPRDPALVRFIGAFVFGLGSAYLLALLLPARPGRVRTVAEVTTGVRLAIGVYTAVAIAAGWLPLPWVSVPATDLALGALQLVGLTRGWFDDREAA